LPPEVAVAAEADKPRLLNLDSSKVGFDLTGEAGRWRRFYPTDATNKAARKSVPRKPPRAQPITAALEEADEGVMHEPLRKSLPIGHDKQAESPAPEQVAQEASQAMQLAPLA